MKTTVRITISILFTYMIRLVLATTFIKQPPDFTDQFNIVIQNVNFNGTLSHSGKSPAIKGHLHPVMQLVP